MTKQELREWVNQQPWYGANSKLLAAKKEAARQLKTIGKSRVVEPFRGEDTNQKPKTPSYKSNRGNDLTHQDTRSLLTHLEM